MLSINQVLQQGRYHILNRFEHEETGVTYQAFDNHLQTNVIIKETTFDLKASPNPYKYPIAKQMENLTSIKHESFTRIHGFFSEVDHQYLVTESVEGQSLKHLLEKNAKPFPLFTVLIWTEQLLDALNYLHSKIPPIIHRDIAPYNLTLTEENKIKLLTYTIIKEFHPQQSSKKTGGIGSLQLPYLPLEVLWETLDYASQKVILNSYDEKSAEILESQIDERSDIYSLGATIYYLVTGKAPVDSLERSIDLLEGKDDPLVSPNTLNPQVPRNVSAFLMKALEIRRENRFASALAMRQALQPMLDLMKKIERETQKAVDDPKVRESALHEVELARQALKKQKEEALKRSQQVEQNRIIATPSVEAKPPIYQELQTVEQKIVQEDIQPPIINKQKDLSPPIQAASPKGKVVSESVLVASAEPKKVEVKEESQVQAKESVAAETASRSVENFADLSEEPSSKTVYDETESDLFLATQMDRKGSSWMIPVICVVVVLLIGGVFGFKFFNSNNSANNNQTTNEQNISNEPERTIQNAPSNETSQPQPSNSPGENPIAPPVSVQEQSNSTNPVSGEQKPNESVVKGKKSPTPAQSEKKTTPTAKTPVPKKKEVTVDDLINDN